MFFSYMFLLLNHKNMNTNNNEDNIEIKQNKISGKKLFSQLLSELLEVHNNELKEYKKKVKELIKENERFFF